MESWRRCAASLEEDAAQEAAHHRILEAVFFMAIAPLYYAKLSSRPETVLFSGLMSYYPNDQAVRWFLNAVLPLIRRQVPHVQITIAGAGPRPWLKARASTNIEVTGTVPDMRPYIARSSVVVAPLHIGGGTRVKILEAQAMCKPVVSTAIGAEGLNLVDGESVLLADDPKKFSSHVVQLLQNPGLAHKISKGGYAHVCRYFSWNDIGEKLNHVLQSHLGLRAYPKSERTRAAL